MLNIENVFDDIYARYYLALVRYVAAKQFSMAMSEEIANETFARLWRRRMECQFGSETAVRVWLYKTAGLVMLEQNRKTHDEADLNACENYILDRDIISEQVEQIQYEQYLSAIKQILSKNEWLLFRLIFIEKKPYAECADELHMHPVTMRANISRMRKKLRPFIAGMFKRQN